MVNIDRFIHSCLDGKKYIFNSDILKLNIDNKEYNTIKRYLKKNNIDVVINGKERKISFISNYTQLENNEMFNKLKTVSIPCKKDIRKKIIIGNTHIVNYLVFKSYITYEIDYNEYSSYAYETLIECVDNFLTSGEYNFYEYAVKKINDKINNYILKQTGMTPSLYSKFIIVKHELECMSNKKINIDDYNMYKEILDIMLEKKYISIKDHSKLLSSNEIDTKKTDSKYLFKDDIEKLDDLLSKISVRGENLIRLHYGIGERKYKLHQLADILECTKSNIGQVINRGINQLKTYIETNYSKEDYYELKQLISNSNTICDSCIIDYPYSETNINSLFNKYIKGKKISRYELRLFDINRKYIINQALNGNDKAMFLALRNDILLGEHIKWIPTSTAKKYYYPNYSIDGYGLFNFSFIVQNEDFEREINNLFNSLKYRDLNKKELKWVFDNKLNIMKNATSGDIKAMYICLRIVDPETSSLLITPIEAIKYYEYGTYIDGVSLYDNIKSGISVSVSIDLTFDYYKEHGCLPSVKEQENCFGTKLNYGDNDYLLSLALKGNDKAMFICLRKHQDNKPLITKNEALKLYPSSYSIDDINLYEGSIIQPINTVINNIFNTLKIYGGVNRNSRSVLINKYRMNLEEWIENNKKELLEEIYNMNDKVVYIVLHSKSISMISIKELLKHYPIDYKIDDILLYKDMEYYGIDSISILYSYYEKYNSFEQDTLTKVNTGIDVRKLFIQNKEIIQNEMMNNNHKAKLIYSEAMKLYNKKSVKSKDKTTNIIEIIHSVYEDYMINGIYPNKNNSYNGLWLMKHQNELIKEAYNKNSEACEILRFYKDKYIEISSINVLALKLCLDNNWLLRRDVRCYNNYYRLNEYQKNKIKK